MKPKTVIFDSSVWLSYMFEDDANYSKACRYMEALDERDIIFMPEIVLYEVVVVLARFGSLDRIAIFKDFNLNISYITPEQVLQYVMSHQDLIRCKTQDYLIILNCLKYNINVFNTFDKKQIDTYLMLSNYENES